MPKKVSRCILKVFSPEVYTKSFGVDVKLSVLGDLFEKAQINQSATSDMY